MPRGNTPQNAWWIGCTTKIVVALQKNAANVVGCENANIVATTSFDHQNPGRAMMLLTHGSGPARKQIAAPRWGRATAATTAQAAAEGRPNSGAVAAQRYPEVRLPRFYGVYEQLAVRGYVALPRWMRVGMRNARPRMFLYFGLLPTAARRRAREDEPGPARRAQGPLLPGRALLPMEPRARGAGPE